ncbi:DUF2786 domain-containing protein [Desulfobacterales bacterium HSG16]|nr:DUF2786 domain-containing protein [Desulfobacterales bacterium HSG16]
MKRQNKLSPEMELERNILLGLACEWDIAIWDVPERYKSRMQKPFFRLDDSISRLGKWSSYKKEIGLSRDFVLNHPWDSVRDVLRHEMAHQLVSQAMRVSDQTSHGPAFKEACRMLRADSYSSGSYKTLYQRLEDDTLTEDDKILVRVKKLMALAQSKNEHEAESAMLKAHKLIERHNIDLLNTEKKRNYTSIFLGKPALRRFREEYTLSRLLIDFYFVYGIWVCTWVVEKGKEGRVLEIIGTPQNVNFASYVYDFVRNYIDAQWNVYNQDKKLGRYRKTDFAVGIIDGFRSKLNSIPRETTTISSTSRALVKHEDIKMKEYIRHRHPKIGKIKRGCLNQDEDVVNDGIELGKKLVIHKGIEETKNSRKFLE